MALTSKQRAKLVSAGIGGPHLNAPTLSGKFIELAQKGKLDKLLTACTDYVAVCGQMSTLEAQLRNCNEEAWLVSFGKRARRRGLDFVAELRRLVDGLEKHKTITQKRMSTLEREITSILPGVAEKIAASPVSLNGTLALPPSSGISKNTDVKAMVRDLTILKHRDLSNEEICKQLDSELMMSDQPPIGFPDEWKERYRVDKYSDAYANSDCVNNVQKLIWKAKQL